MKSVAIRAGDVQLAVDLIEAIERGEEPLPQDVQRVAALFLDLVVGIIEGRVLPAPDIGTVH